MNNYDSVLKEKKTYKDPEPIFKKNKFTKYIFINIIGITILLIIAYIIYYNKILTPTNILANDYQELKEIINYITEPLNINYKENFEYEGTITYNNNKYNYELLKNNQIKLNLSNNQTKYTYLFNESNSYIKYNNYKEDNYIENKNKNMILPLLSLNNNILETIPNTSYIKRLYIENKTPIVEINLTLDKNLINQILNNNLITDDYQIIITIKNNALTNKLTDSKITINNKTKNTRKVLSYNSKTLKITDNNGQEKKYVFKKKKNKDFTVKIYHKDTLYSVLSGEEKSNTYEYNYQVIDKIYNIKLDIENNTTYHFYSNIENKEEKIKEELIITKEKITNNINNNENTNKSIAYSSLSKEDKKSLLEIEKNFFLPINELIKKYKNGI